MKRLKVEEIFIDGKIPEPKVIDTESPEFKSLFEETARRQQEIKDRRDQPFENLTITI